MKKKLSIICAFILTLVVSVASFAGCSNGDAKAKTYDEFFSQWQSYIKDETPLKEVVIAGSHDACTRGMMPQAETQSELLESQLRAGVRYFDLRVAKKGKDFVAFHGIVKGESFTPFAQDLKNFISANISETLILDFQHFENSKEGVLNIIEELGLDKIAIKNSTDKEDVDFVDTLTLGQSRGKVLILWGDQEDGDFFGRDYLFRRNNDSGSIEGAALDSYYDSSLQKLSSKKFIDKALEEYFEKYISKNKGLFVLQGQLTSANAVKSLAKLEESHSAGMSEYIKGLATNAERLAYTNIIMRDFVTDGDKVKEIVALNLAKANVKDASIAEFSKATK